MGKMRVVSESGLYVRIHHPNYPLLLRGCAFVTPYRAGFEDTLYERVYANPFDVGTQQWHQYDRGNEDARCQLQEV